MCPARIHRSARPTAMTSRSRGTMRRQLPIRYPAAARRWWDIRRDRRRGHPRSLARAGRPTLVGAPCARGCAPTSEARAGRSQRAVRLYLGGRGRHWVDRHEALDRRKPIGRREPPRTRSQGCRAVVRWRTPLGRQPRPGQAKMSMSSSGHARGHPRRAWMCEIASSLRVLLPACPPASRLMPREMPGATRVRFTTCASGHACDVGRRGKSSRFRRACRRYIVRVGTEVPPAPGRPGRCWSCGGSRSRGPGGLGHPRGRQTRGNEGEEAAPDT